MPFITFKRNTYGKTFIKNVTGIPIKWNKYYIFVIVSQKLIKKDNLMERYDTSDKFAIWNYSKGILNKTLEEAVGRSLAEDNSGKGKLGQMVERYFFGYEPNSDSTPDFHEAGVELKCTPLKELADKTLQIKERLVCSMIDFSEDPKHSFRESHVYIKCAIMLILFYLHKSGVPVHHLKFLYSVLWRIPEKDLLIMEQDYNKIIRKIKAGKAHELSEGDTTYLGACRKGQKGDVDVYYEYSDIPAPKRAYSLKPQYMRTVLDYVKNSGENAVVNMSAFVAGYAIDLVDADELKNRLFEDILLDRFNAYLGKRYDELCEEFGIAKSIAKSKYALIANAILTDKGTRGEDVSESDEFKKSGIRIKTIRIEHSGRPKEAMSFENINYSEILEEEEWYESRLYEIFTSRFLFVVFRNHGTAKEQDYRLEKSFFWTMPYTDLIDAEKYWKNIKDNVAANHIQPEYFYKISDKKKFHVRPKGRNAADTVKSPFGEQVKKYCYWFNTEYVQEIISNN